MPSLGDDAGDECTVSFWHVEPGEKIEKDSSIVEVATDKAVFDVPASVSGEIVETLFEEGAVVRVGDKIAVIETGE